MARALIIGAGAIGRGFLPWILDGFLLDFYDASIDLTQTMIENEGYRSYMSIDNALVERRFRPHTTTSNLVDLDLHEYDVAFIAVGPRNIVRLPNEISGLTCPVFSVENDPTTVETLVERFFLEQALFGVPDVITSSTASPDHLRLDPLALHTENGVLYLEDAPGIPADLKKALNSVEWTPVEELRREWDAKLYLHNTPHCVAAYLGFKAGCTYLHEALTFPFIRRTVTGVIEEMLLALKITTSHEHRFMEEYAVKELRRFSNEHLFDPISRVAREPLRKLAPDGRLTGALRLALLSGVAPINLMIGIAAALNYLEPRDSDYPFLTNLATFGLPAFLSYHLSISPGSIESEYIDANLQAALQLLTRSL